MPLQKKRKLICPITAMHGTPTQVPAPTGEPKDRAWGPAWSHIKHLILLL